MLHRPFAALLALAACGGNGPDVALPQAARVSGAELVLTLSDGRSCTLPLPPDRQIELEAPDPCRPITVVRVHPAPAPGAPVVLFQFDGEGSLDNDGPPLWVWVGYARGTWLFAG